MQSLPRHPKHLSLDEICTYVVVSVTTWPSEPYFSKQENNTWSQSNTAFYKNKVFQVTTGSSLRRDSSQGKGKENGVKNWMKHRKGGKSLSLVNRPNDPRLRCLFLMLISHTLLIEIHLCALPPFKTTKFLRRLPLFSFPLTQALLGSYIVPQSHVNHGYFEDNYGYFIKKPLALWHAQKPWASIIETMGFVHVVLF